MTTNQTLIEQRVMANVGVIYTARKVFSPTMLKLYVLVLAALAMWRLVWVTRIEQNLGQVMHGGATAVGTYFASAFIHTHLAVQLTLAVAAVAFVMLAVDIIRSAATPRQQMAY